MSQDSGQRRVPGSKAARPRDAATLILYRRGTREIEVLMGERHGGHSFMPNRYVFPGGKVDPWDAKIRAACPLPPAVFERLCRSARPARARALAAAAIRETFEETGLIIGGQDPNPKDGVPESWRGFFASGYAPNLAALDYVLRAVTPPYRPKRFNARFFVADAAAAEGRLQGSGELLDLRWTGISKALNLELPQITSIVLGKLPQLLDQLPALKTVTTYSYRYKKHISAEE